MSATVDKWAALCGPGGFLWRPIDAGEGGDEMPTADGPGTCRDFENGSIHWSPQTGAWEVHGAVCIKWAQLRSTRGFLGFPLTDELGTPISFQCAGHNPVSSTQRKIHDPAAAIEPPASTSAGAEKTARIRTNVKRPQDTVPEQTPSADPVRGELPRIRLDEGVPELDEVPRGRWAGRTKAVAAMKAMILTLNPSDILSNSDYVSINKTIESICRSN